MIKVWRDSRWRQATANTHDRLPHWARLVAAVILVQLLFWLAIKPLVIGQPNPGFDRIEGYEFSQARLNEPDLAATQSAKFEPIDEMPAWHCCEPGYRAFRYAFDLAEVPKTGLGIAPHVHADNFAIYVNGTFIAGEGRLELPSQTFNALLRDTYHIPSGVVSAGRNQVTFILVRDGIPYFDYYPPVLGEYKHISSHMARPAFLDSGYSYLVTTAIAMVALFSLIFFLISRREGEAFWLFLLATALALLSHYYLWIDPPFSGPARVGYFFILSLLVQFSWFGWANGWSRDHYRWMLPAALVTLVLCVLATLYSLRFLEYGPGYDRASEIMVYGGFLFSLATVARLLWNFRAMGEDRYFEAAIALLLVSLIAMQVITEMTSALNMGYLSRTQPFLILGTGIAFFSRRVQLFQSSAQINTLLQSELDERTSQLAVAHDREKRLVRQQALDEERQRIMRDMHDGLGSHLMSMLMMAKRGAGKHSDYADGLQSVIDEMRLMIESMDSVGESLRGALAVFKKRIVPRAKDAGFSIEWTEDPSIEYPSYSPREVLQVFRILQEAITNALKHSGGDRIAVEIVPVADGSKGVRISVSDNGTEKSGAPAEFGRLGGRGLKNMHARAKGLGADLEILPSDAGTSVRLELDSRE